MTQEQLNPVEKEIREKPEVHSTFKLDVINDFDDFFAGWLRQLIQRKLKANRKLRHNIFKITTGPWRLHDIAYTHKDNTFSIAYTQIVFELL